jgi:hypothetical protein
VYGARLLEHLQAVYDERMAEDGYEDTYPAWSTLVALWDNVTAAVKLAGDERGADVDLQASKKQVALVARLRLAAEDSQAVLQEEHRKVIHR